MTEKLLTVDLSGEERELLSGGLTEWGGPARCTNAFAYAMGFANKRDLLREGARIAGAIRNGEPLSERDWTRALLSAELNLGSNVLGIGTEWTTIHGGDEGEWASLLGSLQYKIPWSRKHLPE